MTKVVPAHPGRRDELDDALAAGMAIEPEGEEGELLDDEFADTGEYDAYDDGDYIEGAEIEPFILTRAWWAVLDRFERNQTGVRVKATSVGLGILQAAVVLVGVAASAISMVLNIKIIQLHNLGVGSMIAAVLLAFAIVALFVVAAFRDPRK